MQLLEKLKVLLFDLVNLFKKLANRTSLELSENEDTDEFIEWIGKSPDHLKQLEDVLANTLCCLSYLTPGLRNSPMFWEKFVELITFVSFSFSFSLLFTF
ncbi:hypothetical protein RFI_18687 [Reticulomyxa filosa]|uniref:Uncharacterized protein n=1 Tax=Reticulomyxa filosa TaxID=46433 RepID=X6MYL3_RETFI|nr:hypothetical protein RFI_18687 [Reticulomyxa filosa]|eukprot:ETO18577.1 hypothetical protein RFI_18687 [Reticulomyxa filosa]